MSFSAVILAGGRSSRMGCDKAWLEYAGRSLIAHQLATVRRLAPREVFISGRPGVDYSSLGCLVLHDFRPETGPLAGLEAAMRACTSPVLLVLAVDMPRMTSAGLRPLVPMDNVPIGIIPRLDGCTQPLAASYPRAALPLMERLLVEGQSAARVFAALCVEMGMARYYEVPASRQAGFDNWNSPADLPGPRAKRPSPGPESGN
jgi:molybdopterin-guanine dinucleotide biosynthesis protein A